jgi:hypothetical protein
LQRYVGFFIRALWKVGRNPWVRYPLLAVAVFNFCMTVRCAGYTEGASGEAFNYWASARRVATGGQLYKPWPEYGPYILTSSKYNYPTDRTPYPPPMSAVLAPLCTVSFPLFQRWWSFFTFACFWVYAGCLSYMFTRKLSLEGLLNAGLLLGVTPGNRVPFLTGIVDPFMWALFGLAVTTRFTGAAYIASAWIKLYAGWPFVFSLVRERKRVLRQGALTLAGGFALGAAVCGVRAFRDWAVYFVPVVGQGTFSTYNLSLSMAGLRVFRLLGWHYSFGPLPAWARLWLTGMEFFVPLAVGYLTRRKDPKLQYACVGGAAAACSPLFWISYIPLFLTPLALYIREVWEGWGAAEAPVVKEEHPVGEVTVKARETVPVG